jgi:hypothetical protein
MGPILARLLGDHNHHDRLAEVLPKLSRLQLVADVRPLLSDPSRQPPNERCWSPLSLPAKHICQTVHDSRKFPKVVRPLPSSITLHHHAGDSRKASLVVQISISRMIKQVPYATSPSSMADRSAIYHTSFTSRPVNGTGARYALQ